MFNLVKTKYKQHMGNFIKYSSLIGIFARAMEGKKAKIEVDALGGASYITVSGENAEEVAGAIRGDLGQSFTGEAATETPEGFPAVRITAETEDTPDQSVTAAYKAVQSKYYESLMKL